MNSFVDVKIAPISPYHTYLALILLECLPMCYVTILYEYKGWEHKAVWQTGAVSFQSPNLHCSTVYVAHSADGFMESQFFVGLRKHVTDVVVDELNVMDIHRA